jgi:hypothetical protein
VAERVLGWRPTRRLDADGDPVVFLARLGDVVIVRECPVSDEEYERGLIAAGLPAELAGAFTGIGASIRAGLLETPLGDTDKLIGRTPIGIEAFLAKDQET